MHTDARERETFQAEGGKTAEAHAGLLRQTVAIARDFDSSRVARSYLPESLRGLRSGQRLTYTVGGERRAGLVSALIRRGAGAKARPGVRFTDGLVVMVADMSDVVVGEATLPECAGFAGSGQRCGQCRVHRSLHA